mgnify:CR=1 FL=1
MDKAVLHDHLDGGLRGTTALELAKKASYKALLNVDDINKFFDRSDCVSLEDYLEAFIHTTALMNTYENLERIAYEAAEDMHNNGINLYESRYAPLYSVSANLSIKSVLEAINSGFKQAESMYGIKSGLILCGMRNDKKNVEKVGSIAIDYKNLIIGFDIAGPELNYRPSLFKNERNINKLGSDKEISLSLLGDTNAGATGSFRYDSYAEAIKNTQQLNIDWSKFRNHTFFNSAQAKTNIAISKIINEYPFDQNKKSVEAFFDSLTGFENYVFSKFPKYTGYLTLSGTQKGEDPSAGYSAGLGSHIEVYDSRGFKFPQFSTKNDGAAVIDFGKKPITVEFQTYIPDLVNENQIVIQKQKEEGFGIKKHTNKYTDFNVKININNNIESLNISNSAAIVFHHINLHKKIS